MRGAPTRRLKKQTTVLGKHETGKLGLHNNDVGGGAAAGGFGRLRRGSRQVCA